MKCCLGRIGQFDELPGEPRSGHGRGVDDNRRRPIPVCCTYSQYLLGYITRLEGGERPRRDSVLVISDTRGSTRRAFDTL